jgi:hypothetical protein
MEKVFLKVVSEFNVRGTIAKVGEIVEVLKHEAASLLHREMAVLATAEDAPQTPEAPAEEESDAEDAPQTDDKPAATGKTKGSK